MGSLSTHAFVAAIYISWCQDTEDFLAYAWRNADDFELKQLAHSSGRLVRTQVSKLRDNEWGKVHGQVSPADVRQPINLWMTKLQSRPRTKVVILTVIQSLIRTSIHNTVI